MTTSLALLPAHAPQPQLQPACSHSVLPSARPKLSLNTQQLRTFGKGSSLRLETLSAVSPTARNTFSNGYDAALGEKTKSPLSIDSSVAPQNSSPASAHSLDSSTPSSASTNSLSSASSTDSAIIRIPYTLTHNVTSILSNSPIVSSRPRTTMSSSRPMFPAPKRVSFRTPLVEEIKTTKYTMAHSDITSSASTISTLDSTTSTSSSSSSAQSIESSESTLLSSAPTAPSLLAEQRSLSPATPTKEPSDAYKHRRGRKRDSSESDSDSDICPETPIAGRRKRNRDWVWTLGPLRTNNSTMAAKDANLHSSSTEVSDASASDISDTSEIWHSDASTSTDWHDDDDVRKEKI
ncbi:hypothetical protein K490DRAFT_62721 [Saccharata proteae CBS 121410]|uniref:Uncharacterized protein n=1 Tax=Saccharata proteae CBS 121410 TaxID=1314787 RepID=A0A9P4M1D5_9PEZI|nr:hypothetical protein K490DRAFT_62721 [Saccharata proteae CBS 121410]